MQVTLENLVDGCPALGYLELDYLELSELVLVVVQLAGNLVEQLAGNLAVQLVGNLVQQLVWETVSNCYQGVGLVTVESQE